MAGLETLQLATVEWLKFPEERLIKQHLQLDSNGEVNSQHGNVEYVDNIQYVTKRMEKLLRHGEKTVGFFHSNY